VAGQDPERIGPENLYNVDIAGGSVATAKVVGGNLRNRVLRITKRGITESSGQTINNSNPGDNDPIFVD